MVLAGRFDHVDVRVSSATVPSDKELILKQIEKEPGVEAMNQALRSALKDAARAEFEKRRHNFGSSWWAGPETFPARPTSPHIWRHLVALLRHY